MVQISTLQGFTQQPYPKQQLHRELQLTGRCIAGPVAQTYRGRGRGLGGEGEGKMGVDRRRRRGKMGWIGGEVGVGK